MKNSNRFLPARWDVVIILAVCLVAAVLFFVKIKTPQGSVAKIIQNGTIAEEINLNAVSEPYTLCPTEGVTLLIEKDGVSFLCSDCQSQTCVKTGKCTKCTDSAACIPNQTLVVIEGGSKPDDVDAVSY